MSYNSPRPNHSGLRLPVRSDSSPSISPTSTTPHVFPSSSSNSHYDYPASNLPPPPPPPQSTTTARFHEAFASYPSATRHASKNSASSTDSTSYDPLDTASPLGDRAFDAMQRELGAPPGQQGLGLMEPSSMRGFGSNNGYGSRSREMGRVHEEPEEYQGMGKSRVNVGNGSRDYDAGAPTRRGGYRGESNGDKGHELGSPGMGRSASVDLESSMSFLLSPPPSFDTTTSSSKQFAAAAASDLSKPVMRNGRVFPAPLLLKGGGSTPSSPNLHQTAPLTIPRRPSASSGSLGSPSPGQFSGRGWGSTGRNEREREGPMGPPLSSSMSSGGENSRSNLPYQRHRSQQSSTSSLSQGSYLPYNTNSYSYTNNAPSRPQPTISSSSTISRASPAPESGTHAIASSTSSSTSTTGPPLVPAASSVAPSTTTSPSEPPISSQALLLHIHSLRSASSPMTLSQSSGPIPRSATPLLTGQAHQRIRSAGSSVEPDSTSEDRIPPRTSSITRLDTVDLSHKRIAEVPLEVVDELKDEVEKLALGYNLLKDLPSCFVGFGSKLKYLNVRVNLLTVFPAVLCEMPSIEILDISRNKIRKLPQNPGTLVNLKVFSIAKNRVKRLPTWFTSMSHLKVLKLDHNPLEWPPKEITAFQTTGSISGTPLSKQEEADEMQRWLPALMRWLRDNREREVEREQDREKEKRRKPSNAPEQTSESGHVNQASEDLTRSGGGGALPRAESGRIRNSPSLPSIESFPRPRPRPTLTDYAPLPSTSARTLDSLDSLDTLDTDPSARHSRNASHSLMQAAGNATKPGLKVKKSLPDLRQSHADILAERRTGTSVEEERPMPSLPNLESGALRRLKESRPTLVHSASAKAVLPTQSKPNTIQPPPSTTSLPPIASTIVRSESARPIPRPDPVSLPLPTFATPAKPKRVEVERSTPSNFDRNSGAYFRRQSMLPASTIAKTVPTALLQFADAIRGILFSLSQIYSALRQFVVFASQDRLPAKVARLMGSADQATNSLINALDRFDSLSRRGTPPSSIVRQVFTTCRDNVATFGQLVSALQPQLKSLTATADVRYTRTLLLMLYGSMGEIANSWSTVAPLFSSVDDGTLSSSSTTLILQPPTPSPTLERTSSAASSGSAGGARLTRTRSVTRRHAGSFSVEDVQLGAVLPPAEIPPVPAIPASTSLDDAGMSEYGAGSSTVRARPAGPPPPVPSLSKSSSSQNFSTRQPPPVGLSIPVPTHYQDMVQNAFEQPLTPGGTGLFARAPPLPPAFPPQMPSRSNSSFPLHASTSSYPTPSVPPTASSSNLLNTSLPASYNPHRESRPVSTLNADETFVDQADSTIQIAFDVYGMLLDSFDDPNSPTSAGAIGRKRARELTELCKAGSETTVRLKRGVERVRGGDGRGKLKFTSSDARRLGDASFDFVQTVIKFARAVKTTSTEVAFAPQVREGVGQLTLATREFAKLLSQNQTSFRPTEQPPVQAVLSASSSTPVDLAARRREGSGNNGSVGGEVKVRDYAMM